MGRRAWFVQMRCSPGRRQHIASYLYPRPRLYRPLVEVCRFQKATAQNVRSRQHISSPAHRGPRTGHHPRSSPQPKPLSATKSCKSLRRRALKSIASSAGYSQIHSCSSCTMTLRSKFSLRGAAGRTGSFSPSPRPPGFAELIWSQNFLKRRLRRQQDIFHDYHASMLAAAEMQGKRGIFWSRNALRETCLNQWCLATYRF